LIHDPVSLAHGCAQLLQATRIVLAEQERTTTLRMPSRGDCRSPDEMPRAGNRHWPRRRMGSSEEALFDANGWRAASLGPRILRAETAAIAALAVIASCLE
jgi:16S rRNA (uracil1498-N3)-methyltransferase